MARRLPGEQFCPWAEALSKSVQPFLLSSRAGSEEGAVSPERGPQGHALAAEALALIYEATFRRPADVAAALFSLRAKVAVFPRFDPPALIQARSYSGRRSHRSPSCAPQRRQHDSRVASLIVPRSTLGRTAYSLRCRRSLSGARIGFPFSGSRQIAQVELTTGYNNPLVFVKETVDGDNRQRAEIFIGQPVAHGSRSSRPSAIRARLADLRTPREQWTNPPNSRLPVMLPAFLSEQPRPRLLILDSDRASHSAAALTAAKISARDSASPIIRFQQTSAIRRIHVSMAHDSCARWSCSNACCKSIWGAGILASNSSGACSRALTLLAPLKTGPNLHSGHTTRPRRIA